MSWPLCVRFWIFFFKQAWINQEPWDVNNPKSTFLKASFIMMGIMKRVADLDSINAVVHLVW